MLSLWLLSTFDTFLTLFVVKDSTRMDQALLLLSFCESVLF